MAAPVKPFAETAASSPVSDVPPSRPSEVVASNPGESRPTMRVAAYPPALESELQGFLVPELPALDDDDAEALRIDDGWAEEHTTPSVVPPSARPSTRPTAHPSLRPTLRVPVSAQPPTKSGERRLHLEGSYSKIVPRRRSRD